LQKVEPLFFLAILMLINSI